MASFLSGVLVGGVALEFAALHERAVVREYAVGWWGDVRLLLIHESLLSSRSPYDSATRSHALCEPKFSTVRTFDEDGG